MRIKALSKFFKDKNGRPVILQRPNMLIILWAGLSGLSKVANAQISGGISSFATILLIIWAYLEITDGNSVFRRVLGTVVMAFSVYGIIN